MTTIQCISPVDGSVYVERQTASSEEIQQTLSAAVNAQKKWKNAPIVERQALCGKAVDAFVAHRTDIAEEITWQMGRPISQAPGEVGGFEERARYMIEIAKSALADVKPVGKDGFTRYIKREPLGVVFVVAPWNFPYLTSVNAIIPALLAGNAVVLKHSAQTPLCAERLQQAFSEAGLPQGVFQYLHLTHDDTEHVIQSPEINFVAFTGSVAGGEMVERAAVGRFIGAGLELGGKDPAYVRKDANLQHAIETVTDGAIFNSGQSCCGIERVYVEESIYREFVDGVVDLVSAYNLGRPDDTSTNLGPLVKASAADFVRGQIDEAVAAGANALVDPATFSANEAGTPYLAPQVMIDVDHSMRVMTEETFGPVIPIMSVNGDEEAISLMNDSEFGLTAAIFTQDETAAIEIGNHIDTGTWFMNRCDYLDPALAWTGVKNSGRGCTLSSIGFEHMTRPKSFHLKKV
ncbi:MAG: aldehyde dehydrogenase family protein [Gammaproteobacteria bacterium]|nr:aldehyde dehydrogenase family protein [Gammaproteobacteria bacterium]MDH3857551.1 aldehyde dehydrogenase family protein [Gammaproteobacteria bacterium]